MNVVITGGAGFLGRTIAREIARKGTLAGPGGGQEPVEAIVLFDAAAPETPLGDLGVPLEVATGDIADRATVFGLIDRDPVSVFHLASVVSGGGERDFDLALRVNLEGTLNVLEACRRRAPRPRLVFASSLAVFGGSAMPKTVGDLTKELPQTTYGATKAIAELLVNDYTRKGFLDGRSARLPTVIVRPGAPNLALSGFASGIFREPLNGFDYVCPVGPGTIMPVIGARTATRAFVRLHEIAGAALGDDRAITLPSLAVTVGDMIASVKRVAGGRRLGAIRIEPDPLAEAVCATWPHATDHARALALGIAPDRDLDTIVREYIEDYL